MTSPLTPASICQTRFSVRIDGSPAAVWKTLTEQIDTWWPAEFFAGGEPGARTYHLEARPGGRMYESWQDGGGVLWGTVVTVDPGKRLQVTGSTFPDYGGPSLWFGTWTLEADGESTVLAFEESAMGRVSDSSMRQKDKGWRFLFGAALKSRVEGLPAPAWED